MTPVNAPQGVAPRPFYGEFAWAYDYLIERPVAGECAGMVAALARRGIGPGASLLDAGCGTGRYAVELARHGFVVSGIDRSPALLAEALRRPALLHRESTSRRPKYPTHGSCRKTMGCSRCASGCSAPKWSASS